MGCSRRAGSTTGIRTQGSVDPGRGLVNPRLSDVFGLVIRQDEVDFVVPHMREDLRLYLDPFLLWKSEGTHYRELHEGLLGFVEQVRTHAPPGTSSLRRRCSRRLESRSNSASAMQPERSAAPPSGRR